MISIEGLEKADVLAVLYNAACPCGMGFLQTEHSPAIMRREDATAVIEGRGDDSQQLIGTLGIRVTRLGHHNLRFGYVFGRPLKVDLSRDAFDERTYDHYHGAGHAAAAIAELRASGNTVTDTIFAMHSNRLRHEAAEVLDRPESFTALEAEMGMGDHTERLVALVRRSMGGSAN